MRVVSLFPVSSEFSIDYSPLLGNDIPVGGVAAHVIAPVTRPAATPVTAYVTTSATTTATASVTTPATIPACTLLMAPVSQAARQTGGAIW